MLDRALDAAAPVSEGLACFEYMAAVCERYAVCRHLPAVSEGCLELSRGCSAEFFVEGSTRTIANMSSCAREYADFDCERLLRGESPRCATPGTLPAGAACAGHMACESAFCDDDTSGERTCHALAASGGVCRERTVCPPGEVCEGARCKRIEHPTLDSGDAPQSAVGEACYETSYCREGLFCSYADQSGVGVCASPPEPGQECASPYLFAPDAQKTICDLDSYCTSDGKCTGLPSLYEPCAQRSDASPVRCAKGSFCGPESKVCEPLLAVESECGLDLELSSLTGLPLAPECDPAQGLRCSCSPGGRCESGLGRCKVAVLPGQSCEAQSSFCLYGAACGEQGLCDFR